MSKIKIGNWDFNSEKLKHLLILLDHLAQENLTLRQSLNDLNNTVLHNKQILKDYIDNITHKDQIVLKLQHKIDTLIERTISQDETIKKLYN